VGLNLALINTARFNATILAALLLVPLGSAAAATSITRTVKVTKTVTVRTVITRRIVRTASHRAFYRRHVYGAHTVVFVHRFHPESCFLTPVQVVALDALGPYCDSPRGWHRIVLRY